jgi:transposase-like protein
LFGQDMKCRRFGEEPIIAKLQAREAGVPVSKLCRKHGIAASTSWKNTCDPGLCQDPS